MGNFDERTNYYVDISDTYETKRKALAAHVSQVDMDQVDGWLDVITKRLGEAGGFERAESFIRLNMFI
jgi:LmbE family N-acetylglucosaminyl deacetylase